MDIPRARRGCKRVVLGHHTTHPRTQKPKCGLFFLLRATQRGAVAPKRVRKALGLGLAHAVTLQVNDHRPRHGPLGSSLHPASSPICLPVPPGSFQLQHGGEPSASTYQLLWRTLFHDLAGLQH